MPLVVVDIHGLGLQGFPGKGLAHDDGLDQILGRWPSGAVWRMMWLKTAWSRLRVLPGEAHGVAQRMGKAV